MMMRWRVLVLASLVAAAMMGSVAAQDAAGGKLKVTVDYKGTSGTVDVDHKIWLWVFDTPDISADSTPIAVAALEENPGTHTFAALPKEVYLAAAFDTGGGYDGNTGPPPIGSPIVVHGASAPGMPAAAVATGGDDAAVTVTFDDTSLMP
jgi:uncharacterized protein (DUF2141 family)